MKALDELRSISDGCAYNENDCRQWRSCREHRAQLLDAIEREIAERYQPLPKDADGVPWHIDDVIEWPNGETFEVVAIGDGTLFYVEDGSEKAYWTVASTKRHRQPDTWERIINDAFGSTTMNDEVRAVFVARCKALAGEDE